MKLNRHGFTCVPHTADTLNDIGLSVFTCEKQDHPYFVHESVWHTVCIHSFIQCIKTPSTWYVPGSRLGTGDTGELVDVAPVFVGLTFYWSSQNAG